ncbi:MAG: hypothetical protein JSW63_08460 [Ignavibacterium sp.]|nr:MAG: hypothetical protein JSW63_08460 [Ignavibacterium sp.]
MSRESNNFEILSAYLDGELSPKENEELEAKIKSSLELQKKLEDLKKIKKLTSDSFKPLSPSPFFETRLFAAIDSKKSWYKRILKWSPAIGLGLAAAILMVVLKFSPQVFENLIEEQKSNIAGFYKENLQPLMYTADLNNEDIFNFAMYKKLPLDKEDKQFIHLGEDKAGKEFFEIKSETPKQPENNFEKFVVALELNEIQKDQIDSIINQYAVELENQILVNNDNTLALNSNLWNYQKAIQTDLLAFAETSNKQKFHKFVPTTVSISSRPQVVNNVQKVRTTKHKGYIVLTPDSIFSDDIDYDPIKLQLITMKEKEAELEKRNQKLLTETERLKEIQFHIKYDSSWKKLHDSKSWSKNFNITFDTNRCKVEISEFDFPEIYFPDHDSLMRAIDSVAMNFRLYSKFIPKIEYFDNKIKIEIESDSTNSYEFDYYEFNLDSLVKAEGELIDSLHMYNWHNFNFFSDSLVLKSLPKLKNYLRYYDGAEEFREQMKELSKEMRKFREEMSEWKNEFRKEWDHNKDEDNQR